MTKPASQPQRKIVRTAGGFGVIKPTVKTAKKATAVSRSGSTGRFVASRKSD